MLFHPSWLHALESTLKHTGNNEINVLPRLERSPWLVRLPEQYDHFLQD